jgi:hypothetical protein
MFSPSTAPDVTAAVTDEGVTVSDGDQGGDCARSFRRDVRARSGRQNATTAYMALKIKGDMALP